MRGEIVRQSRGGFAFTSTTQPSEAQRRYLQRGLTEPGGKLPLFDQEGRQIPHKTIETCIAHGWAEPWFANPLKPDWVVCRLTPSGYQVLGHQPPGRFEQGSEEDQISS